MPVSHPDASSELQALLDATVDGVVIIDRRGCIEVFNHAAERLFGYQTHELVGRNVGVLMTDADRDAHDGYLSRYLRTGVPHIIGIGRDVVARRRDGTTFPVLLSVGRIAGSDPPRFVAFIQDTTMREQALLALARERDRANRYLDIVQTVLVAIDAGQRISLINRKGCEILGRAEDELIGCDWYEAAVAPEDRAAARAQLDQLLENGDRPHYCEFRVQSADGRRRLIAWRCAAVHDAQGSLTGVLCSGDDITQRRAIEQAMERTSALLQEAQSIARIGNFEVCEPESDGDYWSPEAYRIFGLDAARGRLSRERAAAFVHPDDRARFDELWRKALGGPGTAELDFRVVQAGGAVRHIHARYQVSDLEDGRRRIAGTLHDITERLQAEEDVRSSLERLTHVSRLATLGEMTAGIAHELNQPLAAIATYAQASQRLLERRPPEMADVQDALAQIAAQALRAGEVIRRFRSVVRAQATQRETSDLNDMIREGVALVGTDTRLHDVRIVLDLAPGLPAVDFDRLQMQQVLVNLLRNAIEALDGERPESRDIAVRTRIEAGGKVALEVCDNGPGVDPGISARMFDAFCTTKAAGTGLGLAVSRTIVEAHGGKLGYKPNVPRGACFQVSLPALAGARA